MAMSIAETIFASSRFASWISATRPFAMRRAKRSTTYSSRFASWISATRPSAMQRAKRSTTLSTRFASWISATRPSAMQRAKRSTTYSSRSTTSNKRATIAQIAILSNFAMYASPPKHDRDKSRSRCCLAPSVPATSHPVIVLCATCATTRCNCP